MRPDRDELLFSLGAVAWLVVLAVTWPQALSFGDEIGYLGRAKLLAEGHLGYIVNSPGIWVSKGHGLVGKYPLFFSLVIAPVADLAPRAAFALGALSALALALVARAVLKSWGKSPLWALLILAHPTIVILARTLMADLPQAAAMLGAWWALRRGRAAAAVACMAALLALKPTGAVLALGLVAGEALAEWPALRARDAAALRRLGTGVAGGVVGAALILVMNELGYGQAWFSYAHAADGSKPFALMYLPERLPTYLEVLLVSPPLLVLGAWALWKRARGPLIACAGFFALMSFYLFVDRGVNRIESIVLAPRLLLPVVVFLLVGYGALLDDLVRRRARDPSAGDAFRLPAWVAVALAALPVATATAVSARHVRYQQAMGEVRAAASALAAERGGVLGLTPNATKAGLLHPGPTTLFNATTNRTPVVFCSEVSASHRIEEAHSSCALPGYRAAVARGGFFALVEE